MDKRQKILIVDDSELNRDILKEILGETYNYLEAENGNQAIQMIGENIGIDLMLLDINMPQMNGFEVLEIMKRSYCLEETPVIMISSEESVGIMRKAYEKTVAILKEHYDKLELVANTLLEKEKISGEEFESLMKFGTLPISEETSSTDDAPAEIETVAEAQSEVIETAQATQTENTENTEE